MINKSQSQRIQNVITCLTMLTTAQRVRLFLKLYDYMAEGDHFGADWATATQLFPERARACSFIVSLQKEGESGLRFPLRPIQMPLQEIAFQMRSWRRLRKPRIVEIRKEEPDTKHATCPRCGACNKIQNESINKLVRCIACDTRWLVLGCDITSIKERKTK